MTLAAAPKDLLGEMQRDLVEAITGAGARARRALATLSLEELCEDSALGALDLSNAQRALCRAADGLPVEHLNHEELHHHFGIEIPVDQPAVLAPGERPRTIIVRSGVRSGKSLIGALASLLQSVLTCTFRRPPEGNERPGADGLVGVRPGELVRALVVAPLLKASRQPFHHLVGSLLASEELKGIIVGTAGAESVKLRREDGNIVTVELVAASAGGLNLRSTWLAGILFDEADFHDGEDAAVNLKENHRAIVPRMLRGAQVWIVSSPWADSGRYHEMFVDAFGKPGRTLAFHASSVEMNPTLDRDDIEEERKRDPENAAREYDAVPLSTATAQFFPENAIAAACVLPEHNQAPTGAVHWAGCDWGFRKNSSALALARADVAAKVVGLTYMHEIIPERGNGPNPSVVIGEFARTCLEYSAPKLMGDWYANPTVQEELPKTTNKEGVSVWYSPFQPSAPNQTEMATKFRRMLVEGKVRLPNNPRLIQQLKDVRARKTEGGIKVMMPKRGASHGDILFAVMLACTQVPEDVYDPKEQPPVEPVRPRERTVSTFGGGRGGWGDRMLRAWDWLRGLLDRLHTNPVADGYLAVTYENCGVGAMGARSES